MSDLIERCAYCNRIIGTEEKINYRIHRDGFGVGPEVPLCDEHGSGMFPTCEEIWDRIAHPKKPALQLVVTGKATNGE